MERLTDVLARGEIFAALEQTQKFIKKQIKRLGRYAQD